MVMTHVRSDLRLEKRKEGRCALIFRSLSLILLFLRLYLYIAYTGPSSSTRLTENQQRGRKESSTSNSSSFSSLALRVCQASCICVSKTHTTFRVTHTPALERGEKDAEKKTTCQKRQPKNEKERNKVNVDDVVKHFSISIVLSRRDLT